MPGFQSEHIAQKRNGCVFRGAVFSELWPSLRKELELLGLDMRGCQPESPGTGGWDDLVAYSPDR